MTGDEPQNRLSVALAIALENLAGSGWSGTAAELLALLPEAARPDGVAQLGRLLRAAEVSLSAAGVVVQTRREAGTGARLLSIGKADAVLATVATSDNPAGIYSPTQFGVLPPPAGAACAVCGSRTWWTRGRFAWACARCVVDEMAAFLMVRPVTVTT